MRAYFFVVLGVLFWSAHFSPPTYALDRSVCIDATDRLRKAARDVADVASQGDLENGALNQIYSGLDDVLSRLNRAKSDCEYTPPRMRVCKNYLDVSRSLGAERARNLCSEGMEKIEPGFCLACLGK